ncbi:hypothetical protein [Beduinella massiliensis]|uniref:hypothetical protein n=1 Tax=Beduinella massiliensis TaxID=1852363 RepID=UPI000C81F87D
MKRLTRAALECAGGMLLLCCAFAAPALLLGLSADGALLCGAYLCAVTIATRALARRTSALWQYIPLCALCCAAALLLPAPPYARYAACALCALLSLWRLYGRAARKDILPDTPSYYAAALFVLAYAAGTLRQDARVQAMALSLCALYALVTLVWRAQQSLGAFLSRYGAAARLPERQLRRTTRGVLAVCCVLALLSMGLLAASGAERIVYALGSLLLAGVRFLFSLLPAGQEAPAEDAGPMERPELGGLPQAEATEPSALWQLLQAVLSFAVMAALIVGALLLLGYLAYSLYKRFARGAAQTGDRVEFIAPPTREERLRREKGRTDAPPLPFTPEGAVRRMFLSAVRAQTRKRPPQALTPREIEDFAGMEPGEAREALHRLYARARYGGGVTREEARALRRILKGKAGR